jgi:hypothetical protein
MEYNAFAKNKRGHNYLTGVAAERDPRIPGTLHYIHPDGQLNDYMKRP